MPGPIVYFARMVPRYRIPVLERLNERLDGRLVVCSGQPVGSSSLTYLVEEGDRSYREIPLRNYWLFGDRVHAQLFGDVFRRIDKPSVVLAEESPRSVTLPLLLRRARREGAGRVLWGHFSSLHRTFAPDRHLQDRYRVALARSVEACVCYTQGVADLLSPHVETERLFVARNTIDLDPLIAQHDELVRESRPLVRSKLNLPQDSAVLVYMGRLIPEKGTDMLMRTFGRLRRKREAALVVIGAGPEQEPMEAYAKENGLSDVHFVGPLPDEEAGRYLFAADVLVMPGYLGLVINHAFAYGLPVVSFADPVGAGAHSPEIEYVESGVNGLLVRGSTPDDLCAGIEEVLSDYAGYSDRALDFARNRLTLDVMVDGLAAAIRCAGG